ncbi:unnamed protein product [Lactuca saligna]|uniref:Endonuclease/exonuclease/phosphatase domain-containing protein n=1 Tax=Lactuca saligna TaxID=75948 RepID=A0AA35UTD3_LACSI|nr:unnamed protein product [Lactuca saligna]
MGSIFSRIPPVSVRYGVGISDHDSEGRLVTIEFDSFYLISGYVPNSGDGLKRLPYRTTEWDPSLSNYVKELEKSKPIILTGDLNCAHQEIDIYNPAGNKRSVGFTIEERMSFEENFLKKGWRLDYFLVSESIADKVHNSFILPDVTGSDHCPIGLVLKLIIKKIIYYAYGEKNRLPGKEWVHFFVEKGDTDKENIDVLTEVEQVDVITTNQGNTEEAKITRLYVRIWVILTIFIHLKGMKVKKDSNTNEMEWLVQWPRLPEVEATWEEFKKMKLRVLDVHLEDKVKVWDAGIDNPK